MPHFTRALSLLVVSAVLAAPRIAQACSCYSPGDDFVAPVDGATDVPVNARIWVGSRWSSPVLTDDEYGDVVPTTETLIEGNDTEIVVLTPIAPLVPGTRYRVEGVRATIFTVGTSTDTTAPTIPTELSREPRVEHVGWDPFGGESSCGEADHVSVSVQLAHDGVLAVVDADGATDLDPAQLSGGITSAAFPTRVTLGRGVCLHSWPEIEEGTTARLRYGSFDLAGNFSGWSEPADVAIPSAGCGCTTTSADSDTSATLAALTALLGVFVLRRRR